MTVIARIAYSFHRPAHVASPETEEDRHPGAADNGSDGFLEP